ncbi:MAG: prepilin-type N-terminal cleavage/methylation domain-containing protein [Syntrophobacteraceae bacterium]
MSAPLAISARPGLRGKRGRRGFTLLEMLVSLIVGTLIVGGVMGLISSSMQYKFRLKDKAQIRPILETAAQAILADPKKIGEGRIAFGELRDSPVVGIRAIPVEIREKRAGNPGQLYRVMLDYRGGYLEFSVLVVPDEPK